MTKIFITQTLACLTFLLPLVGRADFVLKTADPAGNGIVDDINLAETYLLTIGLNAGTAATINFYQSASDGSIPGGSLFPNGLSFTEDFALQASGYVSGLAGPTSFRLGVNSDDGFRLRVNESMVSEYILPRPPGDTFTQVVLKNGDFIRLTFYEHSIGETLEFFTADANGNNRRLVGSPESGIGIDSFQLASVPEPTTALVGLALCALPMLRRRSRR